MSNLGERVAAWEVRSCRKQLLEQSTAYGCRRSSGLMMGCIPEELLPFLAELVWRRSGCLLIGGFVYLGGFVVCCVVLGICVFVGGS